MHNKSQLSLFFVLGIILLVAAGFIIFVSSDKVKTDIETEQEKVTTIEIPSSLLPIKLNIDSCVEETAKAAVTYIGLYGGYYNVPEPKVTYFFDDVPYYVYQGENKMPSLSVIEAQISDYMTDILPECVNALNIEGIKIEGNINFVNASIGKDSVLFYVNYPISLIKGDSTTVVSEFRTKVPVRLDTIYQIASNITQEKIINQGDLCVDCLVDEASSNNIFIDVLSYENNTLIFTIFDNVTTIDEDDYIFSFATYQ
jgi:hypothetical protein